MIVVLLAIAGAVAGVLMTRGGEEIERMEDTDLGSIYDRANESECAGIGGEWSPLGGGVCGPPVPPTTTLPATSTT